MRTNRKIIVLLSLLLLISPAVFSQGIWTWVSGDSALSAPGVYGSPGVPSIYNHPSSVYEASEWKDKQGNFWLYGGVDSSFMLGDLWKYNPYTKEWTWENGDGTFDQEPEYGTQGMPDPSNTPGARGYCSATWVDTAGNLWLFGGENIFGEANDLWEYTISNNEWTWMTGDNYASMSGYHDVQGAPDPSVEPGPRSESCSAWTDSLNNLWLFGGYGYDDYGVFGPLNDVCEYNIATNEWTWMAGQAYANSPPVYGTKGVADAFNDPGARFTYTKWKDLKGNFWIMGGAFSFDPDSASGDILNDVWEYNTSLNEWIWMAGPAGSAPGHYGQSCVFDSLNMPAPRFEHRSSVTDNCGKFWLFGGTNSVAGSATLSDLWQFDSHQLQWKLVSGNSVLDVPGNYGTLGASSPANMPPSRVGAVAWWGDDNKFYLFGGFSSDFNTYCDMWAFTPDTSCTPCATYILPPVASFQSSYTTICTFDCIGFTNLSLRASSYQWLFSGALDSVSTDANPQNICYTKTGTYNVRLIATSALGTDTVILTNYISVNQSPAVPVIMQHHDTLFCSTSEAYTSYQWYRDSNLIRNATDTFLVIPYGGNYNVRVTNEFGCAISAGANVLGIKEASLKDYISLFPNPVTNELLIKNDGILTKSKIEIYNVLGQTISQSEITNPKSEMQMDVSMLSSGIYFLHITTETNSWTGKFVKE